VQLDPGLAGFSQHDSALTGIDVGKQQIQPSLIAALSLNGQGLAVRQPVDAREINAVSPPKSIHVTFRFGDRSPQAHQDMGPPAVG